jgi:hypothetical protein
VSTGCGELAAHVSMLVAFGSVVVVALVTL